MKLALGDLAGHNGDSVWRVDFLGLLRAHEHAHHRQRRPQPLVDDGLVATLDPKPLDPAMYQPPHDKDQLELPRAVILRHFDHVESRLHYVRKCKHCLLYTSPSPRDRQKSRMPSSA